MVAISGRVLVVGLALATGRCHNLCAPGKSKPFGPYRMPPSHAQPTRSRRTEGVRTQGRSARVVAEVLRATVEEIGQFGYEGLRIEDVAARSGVNKTTIYRRWPEKFELVTAAVRHFAAAPEPPNTGSVRADLLALLQLSAERARSPLGRGFIRMLHAERTHPEVERLMLSVKAEHLRARHAVIEEAIARSELPRGTNVELVAELIFAPVFRRIMDTGEPA